MCSVIFITTETCISEENNLWDVFPRKDPRKKYENKSTSLVIKEILVKTVYNISPIKLAKIF